LEDLALKAPIEYLLENFPDEVSNAGRTIKQAGSGLSVSAGGDKRDVVATFISLFPSLTEQQVKEALQKSESSGMLLLWKKLGVFTRINLKDNTPDILIIWKMGGASSVSTDQILGRLWEGVRVAGQPQLLKAAEAIRSLPIGQIIQASTLVQRYSLKQADSAKLLLGALKTGVVQMRFRVRTELLLEQFDNVWRATLEDFPRQVANENGEIVDLSNPENIDVAYERVSNS
jgi:hypothetical protein